MVTAHRVNRNAHAGSPLLGFRFLDDLTTGIVSALRTHSMRTHEVMTLRTLYQAGRLCLPMGSAGRPRLSGASVLLNSHSISSLAVFALLLIPVRATHRAESPATLRVQRRHRHVDLQVLPGRLGEVHLMAQPYPRNEVLGAQFPARGGRNRIERELLLPLRGRGIGRRGLHFVGR